jgi:hypothetical protein
MQTQAAAAAIQHLPSQQSAAHRLAQQPDAPAEAPRRRGRPPRNPEAAQTASLASQPTGVFAVQPQPAANAYSGGVAATQPLPAQTNGSLPASQAVVLNPQSTSAAIDEILKGIPGLS